MTLLTLSMAGVWRTTRLILITFCCSSTMAVTAGTAMSSRWRRAGKAFWTLRKMSSRSPRRSTPSSTIPTTGSAHFALVTWPTTTMTSMPPGNALDTLPTPSATLLLSPKPSTVFFHKSMQRH
ncbi:uncharacterized protein LOC143284144 [Babylonia areolata]|uniref:uncharacterized protein LOC143284144 n=1 Tax=Babylonia areolata TaxID=304850 RepID=UPI003FD3FF15